jgi:hypothetical protein
VPSGLSAEVPEEPPPQAVREASVPAAARAATSVRRVDITG